MISVTLDNTVVAVTVNALCDGIRVSNTIHYRLAAAVGGPAPLIGGDILDVFTTRWEAEILPVLCDSFIVQAYRIRIVDFVLNTVPPAPAGTKIVLSDDFDENPGDATAGTVATPALPNYAAITAKKSTGLLGRGNVGYLRLGGVPEAITEDGGNTIAGASITAINTALADFLVPFTAFGANEDWIMRMVVINAAKAIISDGSPTAGARNVTALTVLTDIGSLISRKK